ncbi:MAG: fumarate hydratase [Methanobrevibacter thaueri]|uniref:Fumarate hydratase n=1 Tax=Methanobrevibacter thaueri TaxID=190975 RepID=A0A8T3VB97_9EURY|nr:fumarate hydratase C-terminal domain-containing protein [Methanobrevibacter thaueri]MBE6502130.1 fumarate hydratase [Methanobrevibacter thaueri]
MKNHDKLKNLLKIKNKIINMRKLTTPITDEDIAGLKVGDKISISGTIYTGRDAALPQLVELIERDEVPFNLEGSVIMHTAFSDAGIAPTTSSKVEIESTIGPLSKAGVKIHIGKGMLSDETAEALDRDNSVFVITPPVAALLTNKVLEKKCVLFENEGMEAMYELKVKDIPGIVAIQDKKRI